MPTRRMFAGTHNAAADHHGGQAVHKQRARNRSSSDQGVREEEEAGEGREGEGEAGDWETGGLGCRGGIRASIGWGKGVQI